MKFFTDIKNFWVATYRDSKLLFCLEAIGAIASIIASYELATAAPTPNMIFVFSGYLIGSIALMWAMYLRQSAWMILLMGWYTAMNVAGLWNSLI